MADQFKRIRGPVAELRAAVRALRKLDYMGTFCDPDEERWPAIQRVERALRATAQIEKKERILYFTASRDYKP